MSLHPYIVDDGALDGAVLVWATTATSAKAMARKEFAREIDDPWSSKTTYDPTWDADVYRIKLAAEAPDEPGFETRPEVLAEAASLVDRG